MQFGIQLHADRGVDAVLEEAQLADAQGFDSVWTGDHLIGLRGEQRPDRPLDTFTLMTAIGATTRKVRLAFATLNPSFRNPALLAKMLATLDQITHGRLICTLGAGWFQEEYTAYDLPFVEDHDERIDQEREVVELFKELWTHPSPERVTYAGKYVTARNLPFSPAPFQQPHPPIWIGGNSASTQKLVKDHASGWILLSAGGMREVIAEARQASDWPSREMTIVGGANVFTGETHAAAEQAAREAFAAGRVQFVSTLEALMQGGILGTRDEVLARFEEMAAWGVSYLRLTFSDLAQQTYFAEHVLPYAGERVPV